MRILGLALVLVGRVAFVGWVASFFGLVLVPLAKTKGFCALVSLAPGWFAGRLVFASWLVSWLPGWLAGWLVGWLVGWLFTGLDKLEDRPRFNWETDPPQVVF